MTEHSLPGDVRGLDTDDVTGQNRPEPAVVSVAEVAFSSAAAASTTVPR